MSSSSGRSSMLRLYLNPEQPPGSTLTRRPARLGRHLLLGDELLHLFSRPFGQGHAEARWPGPAARYRSCALLRTDAGWEPSLLGRNLTAARGPLSTLARAADQHASYAESTRKPQSPRRRRPAPARGEPVSKAPTREHRAVHRRRPPPPSSPRTGPPRGSGRRRSPAARATCRQPGPPGRTRR